LTDDITFNGSGDLTISAGIDLGNATRTLTVDDTCVTTLLGSIIGGGGINKAGSGTLVLSGNNSYSLGTQISAGTLVAASDLALGQSFAPVTLNGGTLQAGGTGDRTLANPVSVTADSYINGVASNALTLTGDITLQNSPCLTVKGAGNVALAGAISGNGEIDLTSTGTLTLSGNNTYTGGTTIAAGTLAAAGKTALGAGAVTVGANATDTATLHVTTDLGAGDFTLNEKGVLQVDAGKTLTLGGSFYNYSQTEANWPLPNGCNLTMSGSTFEVAGYDYGAAAAGFTSNFNLDTLTVTGNLDLVDEANNGNRGGVHGDQEALYINLLTGSSGSTLDLNGYWLYVFNSGDYFPLADGLYNDIMVTGSPVPLPGSLLLLGSGLLGLAGWRRFRRS